LCIGFKLNYKNIKYKNQIIKQYKIQNKNKYPCITKNKLNNRNIQLNGLKKCHG